MIKFYPNIKTPSEPDFIFLRFLPFPLLSIIPFFDHLPFYLYNSHSSGVPFFLLLHHKVLNFLIYPFSASLFSSHSKTQNVKSHFLFFFFGESSCFSWIVLWSSRWCFWRLLQYLPRTLQHRRPCHRMILTLLLS